jgi:hypothetical protein
MIDFLNSIEQTRFSIWVRESSSVWAFPMFLFLHTLGMSIVAGLSAMISLVLLGLWPKTAVKPLERLYPLIWVGFWLNAITGLVLLYGDAVSKLTNWDFYVKMTCVFTGIYIVYVMRKKVFGDPQLDKAPVSGTAKQLAWASLTCWFLAIVSGRLLAYLGPVAGVPGLTNR